MHEHLTGPGSPETRGRARDALRRATDAGRQDLPAIVGFAAFLAVLDFLLWGGAVSARPRPYDSLSIFTFFAVPCFLVSGAALATLGAVPRLMGAVLSRPSCPALVEALGVGGGLCLLAWLLSADSAHPALLCLAASLLGAGVAAGLLGWGRRLAGLPDGRLVSVVGCACTLFPLVSLAMTFAPTLPRYLLAGILACCSITLRRPEQPDAGPVPTACTTRDVWHAYGTTALCFASLGFVAGLSRMVSLSNGANNLAIMLGSPLFTLIAGLTMLVIWHRAGKLVTPSGFFQAAFPFVATGFVVFSLTGLGPSTAFACFANFFFEFMLVVIAVHSVSDRAGLGACALPAYCLAIGLALTLACAGTVVSLVTRDLWLDSLPGFALSIVVCIYVLSMALVMQARAGRGRGDAGAQDAQGKAGAAQEESGCSPAARIESTVSRWADEMAEEHGLTARERQILALVVRGTDTPTIASELGVSDNTVRTHKKSLYRKLEVHSKQELLALMQGNGEEEGLPSL